MAPKKSGSGSKGPATARKSGDGRFTTPAYAKAHPKTTEIEHNKKPKGK